jgi:hypothetical protein
VSQAESKSDITDWLNVAQRFGVLRGLTPVQ